MLLNFISVPISLPKTKPLPQMTLIKLIYTDQKGSITPKGA
jgi:hypothetical protein